MDDVFCADDFQDGIDQPIARQSRIDPPQGPEPAFRVNQYFVDEAGDLTFFGDQSSLRLGTPGCSKTFMIGIARIIRPRLIHDQLNELRLRLISDPAFRDLPSVRHPKKTSLLFHACKDHPLIRRNVFEFIAGLRGVCALIAVRRKHAFLDRIEKRLARGAKGALSLSEQNSIYDHGIKTLVHDSLHKVNLSKFRFAKRGKSGRTESLRTAILDSNGRFLDASTQDGTRELKVAAMRPHVHGGLQIIDYLLWALHRGFERDDWESFDIVRGKYAHIHDIDDESRNPRGRHYSSRKRPLTLEKANALWKTTPTNG